MAADDYDPAGAAMLTSFAEKFAAEGSWSHAIGMARMALEQYEVLAEADPTRFAGLADEATAIGAPTAIGPSDEAREWITAAGDPTFVAALAMAVDLDRLEAIPARALRRADDSVRLAVSTARLLPGLSVNAVVEKLARHAVLLRRFDRYALAHDAAAQAVSLYDTLAPDRRNASGDGYIASCLLILARSWFETGDLDSAYPMAKHCVDFFMHHYTRLRSANMFDLVMALTILAVCQREHGAMDEARQSIVDAKFIADRTERAVPGPPGSIRPTAWGLPVVPSEEERKGLYG